MIDVKLYSKWAAKKYLTSNLKRKGWTDDMAGFFFDVLWRDPYTMRTSGFAIAGGTDALISWSDVTRIFTITPYDPKYESYIPKFDFYAFANKISFVRKTAEEEIELPDEEGLYVIYYAGNDETRTQVLNYIKNPTEAEKKDIYLNKVIVSWIYWNATVGEASYFGDSRHGSEWNPAMHWMWHQTLNSQRQSGFSITDAIFDGGGTSDTHYQFGISSGEVWHEDILQSLPAVGATDSIPVWYFDSDNYPRFVIQTGKKFLNNGRVAFNSSGTYIQATDGYYITYHLFATNCTLQPHISAMGQAEYETLGTAMASVEAEIANLRQQLPHSNLMHIFSIVLQTSEDYTNSAKARLVCLVQDVITDMSITGTGTATQPIKLKNDEENPGILKYYGTDENQEKGFFALDSKLVNQAGHGLSVNDAIRDNGTIWIKAKADSAENAQTGGIVVEIIDTDNFRYQSEGFYVHQDFERGKEYVLSPTVEGEIIEMPDESYEWETGWVIQSLGWGTDRGLKIEISTGVEIVSSEMAIPVSVETTMSVVGNGSSSNKVRLKNDETNPSLNKYFGTDKNENVGYHELPKEAVQTLTSPADTFDMESGRGAKITLTADTTITFDNLQPNDNGHIDVVQDGTGGRKLFFDDTEIDIEISENSYDGPNEVKLTGVADSKDVVAWWWTGTIMKLAVIYNFLS